MLSISSSEGVKVCLGRRVGEEREKGRGWGRRGRREEDGGGEGEGRRVREKRRKRERREEGGGKKGEVLSMNMIFELESISLPLICHWMWGEPQCWRVSHEGLRGPQYSQPLWVIV